MSRKKSKKIETKSKKLSEQEFKKKVLELENKGLTSEKIGEILRKEGIHPKEHAKISKVLKEKRKYINPDIKNLEEKLGRIKKHYEKNKQNKRAIREKERIAAKIRKLKSKIKLLI